jgi:hypothetical protein
MDAGKTFALLVFLLTSGCASFSEVKKENRDLRNSYDGDWIAKHQTTDSYQEYGIWQFDCNQLTTPIRLRIEGSGIQVHVNHEYIAPLKEAYISSIGNFKTALPTGIKGKTSINSDISRSDIEIRLIIEGNLTPDGHGTGNIIIGYAVSRYDGCKTKSVFTKE